MYFGGNGAFHVYGGGVANFPELEALFVKNGVNLCLWGHVHNLLATCPVYNGTCIDSGIVHVVLGNGGQSLTRYSDQTPVPEWVDFKLDNFGWNELVVEDFGRKLAVNMYSDKDDSLYHSVLLTR